VTAQRTSTLPRLLVVDDDARYGQWLGHHLGVFCPDSPLSVLNLTEFDRWCETDSGRDCDILLLTASFGSSPEDPKARGLELLRRLRGRPVFPAVIALAEEGNELTAVRALQLGAVDYLPKRLLTPERLNTSVRLALRRLEKRVQRKLASLTHVTDVAPPEEETREQPKAGGSAAGESSIPVAAVPTSTATPGSQTDAAPAAQAARSGDEARDRSPDKAGDEKVGAEHAAPAQPERTEASKAETDSTPAQTKPESSPLTTAVEAASDDGGTQLMAPGLLAAALDAAAASAMAADIKATESSVFGTTVVGAPSRSKSGKSGSSRRASTPSPAVTAEFIPGYIIKMKIGESEKAVVYLATSISLGSNVALKVSKTLRDDTAGRQFLEREYTAIIAIRDPLVVQIYDYGVHAGFEYLAMEYLLRGDLKARMQAGLKEAEALRYVEQIASALRVVHNAGLLHRDLKPPNVMLRDNDEVALIDFGLARALDGSTPSTRTGVLRGSPYYMSPEQAQGEQLDVRSDFYSLGIMFYEMLTGRKPYTGATAMEVLQQHVNSPLPPLPHSLSRYEHFLHKLVAKNRTERFTQAEEIIAAVGELRTAMTLNVESAVA
jgi:CheY-like chemotaxis protein